MRIAISGSHVVGKSTLAEELDARLAAHFVVDEPYRLLEDEGYEFPDQLDVDDYVVQLRGTDSIPPPPDNHFRLAVDGVLREVVTADELGVCGDLDVVEVTGPVARRVNEVMRRISLV